MFSAFGGMSRECERFYKQLAEKLADKQDMDLSTVTNYIRTVINFSLIKSTVLCIRGSRRINRPSDQGTELPIGIVLESAEASV